MDFKKEYKRAFDGVSAGDDFKAQLAQELNVQRKKKTYTMRNIGMLATAAAMLLVVGTVSLHGVTGKDAEPNVKANEELVFQAGGQSLPSKLNVSEQAWYKDAKSDEEKYIAFIELMNGDSLQQVYCSETEKFTKEDILSKEQVKQLVDRLANAGTTTDTESGDAMYFKAEFADGVTIAFRIWDDNYIKIVGIETGFKM